MFVDPSRNARMQMRSDRAFSWTPSSGERRNRRQRLAWLSVDHLAHGLMIFGEAGTVLDANVQAEAILGYASGELIGVPIAALLPEHASGGSDTAREFLESFWGVGIGGTRRVKGARKDRSIVALEIELSVFVEGDARYFAAVITDATRRLESEPSVGASGESQAFQRLIADLVTRLGKASADALDDVVVDALRRLGQALPVDQSILWRKSLADGAVLPTHYWAQPPSSSQPDAVAIDSIPEVLSTIEAGETFVFGNLEELPDADREGFERAGLLSGIVTPLSGHGEAGEAPTALVVGSMTGEQHWTPATVDGLRLVAGIMNQAFARQASEYALEKANQEIRQLRDRLTAETVELRREVKVLRSSSPIISESATIQKTLAQIEQVAHTPATVLLLGETGTGKEVMAQAIHNMSPRHQRQMIRVSCAAIPTALIESELFGRERGAYTGALSRQIGRFEAANQSTLFLDEVGELPAEVQVKLLRVLQERVVERLGSTQSIKVDVRIIAATNKNLEQAVADKTFREDLFYRLNVFPITVPPLRERVEDIPGLVWSFIDEFSRLFGKNIDSISKDSLRELQRYPWPGNVRELRNVIERAIIIATTRQLVVPAPRLSAPRTTPRLNMTLTDLEIEHIRGVLESTNWRVRGPGGAAERLGLKPTTLESRMARLGIERKKAS
jgi:formate hydrogenlyase transcriptional activator